MGARYLDSMSNILIFVCVFSFVLISGESLPMQCSRLLEKLKYCQRRSSTDTAKMPLYHDVPQETTITKDVPPFNPNMYTESMDVISDPALQREIESTLKLSNPIYDQMPVLGFDPILYPQVSFHQEGKLSKNKIINKLYKYITWEEAQKRSVSKVARVAGRITGDIAAMMTAEKFRKIGMFAGDLTRILVSDLTMKGLDGFQAMLGIKI